MIDSARLHDAGQASPPSTVMFVNTDSSSTLNRPSAGPPELDDAGVGRVGAPVLVAEPRVADEVQDDVLGDNLPLGRRTAWTRTTFVTVTG